MSPQKFAAVLTMLALGAGLPAEAFTPRTRADIVRRAMTLMPDSLQDQMKRHARTVYRNALEPNALGAEAQMQHSVEQLVAKMDSQQRMSSVMVHFGELARAATDLSFALNVSDEHEREAEIYQEYSRYVEEKLPRMSVTFLGFTDSHLNDDDLSGFASDVASRARRDYDAIMRSYFPEGRRSTTQDFDDRSVAFASASIEVSLAVTATARAWLYAWNRAHGDLEGAPMTHWPTSTHGPFAPPPDAAPKQQAAKNENRKEEVQQ